MPKSQLLLRRKPRARDYERGQIVISMVFEHLAKRLSFTRS